MKLSGLKLTIAMLAGVIVPLLWGDFVPGLVQHSNDGPLGRLMSECHQLPGRFTGCWEDLDVVGFREGSAVPDISFGLQWLLKPILFSKFYAPITLMLLGVAAWTFFRQLRFSPTAANLGALAAVLNSSFFSAACWGSGPHVITVAMAFFAVAALADLSTQRRWLRVALAGMALGMAVCEGADVGALFSVLVAAFAVCQALACEGPFLKRLSLGVLCVLLMAFCAAWLAADALSDLVANDVQPVASTRSADPIKHWNWATQWSLPKSETLSFIVPGLFGYRDDTLAGGEYWGSIGREPRWDDYVKNGAQGEPPSGFRRYSGGGVYAGVAVVLLAIWAGLQSFRTEQSVFSLKERRWIWFWIGLALVALLLAYGRHAPFYRLIYALPYVSTVRNPAKFTHLVSFALVVMFAYAVDGLWRTCVQTGPRSAKQNRTTSRPAPGTSRFDKRWLRSCALVFAVSLIAAMAYAANRSWLARYLESVQFEPDAAQIISRFSIRQPIWFLIFFAAAALFTRFASHGAFSGERQLRGAVVLGLILALDLGRANLPWIIFWNYHDKYATNPIVDILRDKTYEHRVALLPFNAPPRLQMLRQIYKVQWSQHNFPYYNIQASDVLLAPRLPEDIARFDSVFNADTNQNTSRLSTRCWELTNTRYLLGITDPADTLNDSYDPRLRRYHAVERFAFVPKPGILDPIRVDQFNLVTDPKGPFCLFEFAGALPRARLYSKWEISTNDSETLAKLADESFDPAQTILVSGAAASALPDELRRPAPHTNAQSPSSVEFLSYSPKKINLSANASGPSVLLLNDHYDPGWDVTVDGAPATLMRCNYLMRGVFLGAGAHQIEFRFGRPPGPLWISLSAVAASFILAGIAVAPYFVKPSLPEPVMPIPTPVSEPSTPKASPPPRSLKRNRRAKHQPADK